MQIETLRSVYVEPMRDGERLGDHGATAFFVGRPNDPILVSAWHVFSGLNAIDGSPISSKGAPDTLRVHVPEPGATGIKYRQIDVPLFAKTQLDHINRVWWDHPRLGCKVDAAAVRLSQPIHRKLITPIEAPFDSHNLARFFVPTTGVSVIGYPFGRSGPQKSALWTTCSVASEYGTDEDHCFWIDGRTREGQSGSPVLMYRPDGNLPNLNGNLFMNGVPASRFVGLYSGRLNKDSDLGRVWKPLAVVEVCCAAPSD